jgi:hypothetical protein
MHQNIDRADKTFSPLVLSLLFAALACGLLFGSAASVSAQTQKVEQAAAAEPGFHGYKGVSLGMSAAEARKKLGTPEEKSDEQDFYVVSDKESVQIYYDKAQMVEAISVNYVGESEAVPKPKAVLGTDLEAKPDGSMHKMIRFPKAGYWLSYSRTAGDSPLITITLKKI